MDPRGCDSHRLTDLEIFQPAFGIDIDGVQVLPAGALHVQGVRPRTSMDETPHPAGGMKFSHDPSMIPSASCSGVE